MRNAIERAAILAEGPAIGLADFPERIAATREGSSKTVEIGGSLSLEELEIEHVRRVLASTSNLDEAARVLGIDPSTLYRKANSSAFDVPSIRTIEKALIARFARSRSPTMSRRRRSRFPKFLEILMLRRNARLGHEPCVETQTVLEGFMTRTLRTRLLIGIAPLLAIMVGLGLWAVFMFSRLGGNIDVILRENYRSVLAAENMKEALERMDSSFLFAIGGQETRARDQFREYRPIFDKHLKIEQGNITLPGEQELADELTTLHERYVRLAERFFALPKEEADARASFISASCCRCLTT